MNKLAFTCEYNDFEDFNSAQKSAPLHGISIKTFDGEQFGLTKGIKFVLGYMYIGSNLEQSKATLENWYNSYANGKFYMDEIYQSNGFNLIDASIPSPYDKILMRSSNFDF